MILGSIIAIVIIIMFILLSCIVLKSSEEAEKEFWGVKNEQRKSRHNKL